MWVVTPGDPLVEAMRWAAEHEREVLLVDPDLRYGRHRHDQLPDPHSLHHIGCDRYVELIRQLAGAAPYDERDTMREKGIAHHVQQAVERTDGPILCLVGAAHADRVVGHLKGPTAPPLARQRRSKIQLRHLHPESLTAVLPDPPLAHAVYEYLRTGSPPDEPEFEATIAPRLELPHGVLTIVSGGRIEDRAERARALAAWAAHHGSREGPGGGRICDRAALGAVVWKVGAASYTEQTHSDTPPWQRRLFFNFVHRYARIARAMIDRDENALRQLAEQMGYIYPGASEDYVTRILDIIRLISEPVIHGGVYDFGSSDVFARGRDAGFEMVFNDLSEYRPPPPETIFLHRKLVGCFMLCSRIGARVNVMELIEPFLPPGRTPDLKD